MSLEIPFFIPWPAARILLNGFSAPQLSIWATDEDRPLVFPLDASGDELAWFARPCVMGIELWCQGKKFSLYEYDQHMRYLHPSYTCVDILHEFSIMEEDLRFLKKAKLSLISGGKDQCWQVTKTGKAVKGASQFQLY